MNIPKKILFVPLDWGLGHASRCIPLIQACLSAQNEVIVAGNKTTNRLIGIEFPQLQYLELKGYNVKYSTHKWQLPFTLLTQLPKILSVMKYENKWLNHIVQTHQIDLIISDNRYGLYHHLIPSYIMTHQLQIQVPQSSILQQWVNAMHHRMLKKFTACLIPDYEDVKMSGALSDPKGLQPTIFLGNLSRFTYVENVAPVYDLLLLLSGPEPQRSIFEQIMLNELKSSSLKVLVVRGKPGAPQTSNNSEHIHIKQHLNRAELQEAILSSNMVVCRSGYSTIMDLIKLRKHAVIIPTPGQTEQEYLATYLMDRQWFLSIDQKDISLNKIIQTYNSFAFQAFPAWDMNLYQEKFGKLMI